MNEDLRNWFRDKWVRMNTKGDIIGDCARDEGEGKPKCLPIAKARAMSKDDRAAAARRKRREDPVADRAGKGEKPVNVATIKEQTIRSLDWKNKEPADYAIHLSKFFGKPDSTTDEELVWESKDGFKRIVVKDEYILHSSPAPHYDFIYCYVDLIVPVKYATALAESSGSILIDFLKGEVGARCGSITANATTINYVLDVVAGRVKPSKEEYEKRILSMTSMFSRGKKFKLDWWPDETKDADPSNPYYEDSTNEHFNHCGCDIIQEVSTSELIKKSHSKRGAPGTLKAKIKGPLTLAKVRSLKNRANATTLDKKQANFYINMQSEEYLEEKNVPTNPALWARAKTLARSKFDVYPSAYANGWAAKWYKGKGGSWKSVQEGRKMKTLNDILAEGVAVSSDFKLVNSVNAQGKPITRKVRAHRKTISPQSNESEDKSDVLTSIQNFVGRQYGEEVEQMNEGGINDLPSRGMFGTDTKGHYGVYRNSGPGDTKLKIVSKHKTIDSASKQVDKLRKKSGKDDHYYGHLSAHQPEQGKIPKDFHEEVELDEVSTDGYHKAAVKSRKENILKIMTSMGSDKSAKTKVDARNKGLKRLGDRTSAEMAKANSGPQKPRVEKEPTEAERRGYGQGRYMGDSVELEGEIIEASQSASVRMFKALQKIKQQRETEEARKKENEKRALTPKPTNEAKDPREYDYEGDMAKTQLRSIIANSQTVHDMLKDTTNIAEWVQSKITKAEDYISTVADYMTAEMNEQTYDPFADDPEADAKHEAEVRAKMRDKLKKGEGTKIEKMNPLDRDQYLQSTGRKWNDETKSIEKIKPQAAATNEAKEEDDDEDYTKHHKLDPDSGVEADQHIHVQLKKAIDSTMKPYEVSFKNGKKHSVSSPVAKTIVSAIEKLKPEHRKFAHDELHKSYDSLMAVHKAITGK
jgi:hypothetical protein